eukprot:SAG31_NODE_5547_length_2465_cov_17.479290_2_plen_161_part_00
MCQTRVRIVAKPFGSVTADAALASVRTGACCPADGRGDQACGLRELAARADDEDDAPSLCMESAAVARDNYFVTASGMVVDNATGAVFPATQLVRGHVLVFVQLLEKYGTLIIERYTALIEKVSACSCSCDRWSTTCSSPRFSTSRTFGTTTRAGRGAAT